MADLLLGASWTYIRYRLPALTTPPGLTGVPDWESTIADGGDLSDGATMGSTDLQADQTDYYELQADLGSALTSDRLTIHPGFGSGNLRLAIYTGATLGAHDVLVFDSGSETLIPGTTYPLMFTAPAAARYWTFVVSHFIGPGLVNWPGFERFNLWALDEVVPEPLIECRPLIFDVYAPGVGASSGILTYVESLCTSADQWILVEELDTGSGGFRISRHSLEATAAILGDGVADARLVKARIPEVWDLPPFGFWIETGPLELISEEEEGGEDITLGGRGALAYLDRAVMAPRSYLVDPNAVAGPVGGVWRFERPDFSSSLGFLASDANGTGSLVDTWQLPSISPAGDDVLLLALVQVRANEDLTLPAGWTNRVQQDTSQGFAAGEIRYVLADRYHAAAAAPYADSFDSAAPVRWTAAQLGFRATGAPSPETASAHQAASGQEDVISATLSGAPTPGNVIVAYVSQTTDGPGVMSYEFPSGWTILERIPNKNTYTGYAVVAYKPADGTETDVEATVRVTGDGTELTSTSLLVAEYPIVYEPLKAGEILYIVVSEVLQSSSPARPVHSLPLLSIDFTYELDSNGAAWDETPSTAQFTAQVGENLLDVVGRLLGTGALVLDMDVTGASLVLHAYNRSTYGRDLTGAAFGAGVVRLEEATSIASGLRRERVRPRAASHAWALGDEDTYALEAQADAASRVTREVAVRAQGSTDGAALAGVADAELAGREEHAERLSVGMRVGNAPGSGSYFPGPAAADDGHVWPGDRVTVATGTGDFDYDDVDFRVAAIMIEEQKGENAAVVVASDLDVELRLGSNMEPGSVAGSSDSSFGSGIVGSPIGTGSPSTNEYQLRSEKGQPDGYASIDTDGHVPPSELGSGAVGDGSRRLADDGTWVEDTGVTALDDLSDVEITSVADGQRLRYDGAAWVNTDLIWRPIMVEDPVSGDWFVVVTGDGDAVMVEA